MILLLGKLDYLELWYHNTGRWSVAFVADWGVLLLGLELQREQASWQQQQQKQFTTVAKHRNQQLKTNQSASHTHKIQYLILSLLGIFYVYVSMVAVISTKKVYGFACFVLISCSFIVVLVGFLLGVHFVVNGSDVFLYLLLFSVLICCCFICLCPSRPTVVSVRLKIVSARPSIQLPVCPPACLSVYERMNEHQKIKTF